MTGASLSALTVCEAAAPFPDRAHFRAAVSETEAVPAGFSDEIKYIAPPTIAGIVVLSGGPISAAVAALVADGLAGAALTEMFDDSTAPCHTEFKAALEAGAAL
jgi:hypothetical protein